MQTGFPKRRATRTAEELIALGDQTGEIFSDTEINDLFRHLWEQCITLPEYDECRWIMLQWHLCRRKVQLSVFPEERVASVDIDLNLPLLFHRLWTDHVGRPGYKKMEWKVFRKQLSLRSIFV